MKHYTIAIACSTLLIPCIRTFGMEVDKKPSTPTPSRKTIIKKLEEIDPGKLFVRPDEYGIYTPAIFMKNLHKTPEEFKELVDLFLFQYKIKNQNNVHLEGKEKNGFQPNKKLNDSLWVLNKIFSMATGIDLESKIMQPNKTNCEVFYYLIGMQKKAILERLQ